MDRNSLTPKRHTEGGIVQKKGSGCVYETANKERDPQKELGIK